jgi:hypothetical protein
VVVNTDIDLNPEGDVVRAGRSPKAVPNPRRARSASGRNNLSIILAGGLLCGTAGLAAAAGHSHAPQRSASSSGLAHRLPPGSQYVDNGFGQVTVSHSWRVQAQVACVMPVDRVTPAVVSTGIAPVGWSAPSAASAASVAPSHAQAKTGAGGKPNADAKPNIAFVGVQPYQTKACGHLPKVGPHTSAVWLFSSSGAGTGQPVLTVNGFKLYAASQGSAHGYLAPALGVEFLWTGARPTSVIHSISWSPLHTVVTAGPITRTPKSWARHYFDGMSVASPASWPVEQPLKIACSTLFANGPVVGLGVKVEYLPCPFELPSTVLTNGVVLTRSAQIAGCPIRSTMTIAGSKVTACSDPADQPPDLQVKLVTGSGSTSAVVYATVGLGSDPSVARTVLGSLAWIVPAAG